MKDLRIRPAVESDAAGFLELWDALDTETEFMLFEPNERQETLDAQRLKLAKSSGSEHVHVLVLEDIDENSLAGFCAGRRSQNARDRHVLHVVIGIREGYTGKQWGFKLLTQLEQWALSVGITRLELSVMVTNTRAIALYDRLGFINEGTRKNSVLLRSGYVDELAMAKTL